MPTTEFDSIPSRRYYLVFHGSDSRKRKQSPVLSSNITHIGNDSSKALSQKIVENPGVTQLNI